MLVFGSIGSNENFGICFWDLLTFNNLSMISKLVLRHFKMDRKSNINLEFWKQNTEVKPFTKSFGCHVK